MEFEKYGQYWRLDKDFIDLLVVSQPIMNHKEVVHGFSTFLKKHCTLYKKIKTWSTLFTYYIVCIYNMKMVVSLLILLFASLHNPRAFAKNF